MSVYKNLLRPLLFSLDAEQAHQLSLQSLSFLRGMPLLGAQLPRILRAQQDNQEETFFGLNFKNWVGLAAGMDKNGDHIEALSALGFGHLEVGTVTPKPQAGNPKPRMFRLPKDKALINRMGFNNKGVDHLRERLSRLNPTCIIGANIGKNKDTPNSQAHEDYLKCFTELVPYCHYFTINVSSPNTPGLRELQHQDRLRKILSTLQSENVKYREPRPLLLKLAPDLEKHEVAAIVEISMECGLSGLVLSNTTTDRKALSYPVRKVKAIGNGGLSGKPLLTKANKLLAYVSQELDYPYPIIAVGGIMSPEDAQEKLQLGADLVQVYSGLVYEGPQLVRSIKKGVQKR